MANILILDHDLGFRFWLGMVLSKAGHTPLPVPSVSDAKLLMRELNFIPNILVMDTAVRGAMKLMTASLKSNRHIRVLAISDDSPNVANIPGVTATLPRPTGADPSTQAIWVECIEDLTRCCK